MSLNWIAFSDILDLFTHFIQDAPRSRWEVIRESLQMPIASMADLEGVIKRYNTQLNRSKFKGLESLGETFSPECEQIFFDDMLPILIRIVLDFEEIFPNGIPRLAANQNLQLTISQFQAMAIVAGSFLCVFDEQPSNYPSINMDTLFVSNHAGAVETLKCIVNYLGESFDNRKYCMHSYDDFQMRRE